MKKVLILSQNITIPGGISCTYANSVILYIYIFNRRGWCWGNVAACGKFNEALHICLNRFSIDILRDVGTLICVCMYYNT